MNAPQPDTYKRLFFALWPDQQAQSRLGELVSRLQTLPALASGRIIPAENRHITLLFLGDVNVQQAERLLQVAGAIDVPPFTLRMNRLHYRAGRSGMLWLTGDKPAPEPLGRLVSALRRAAQGCRLKIDRRPYVPHITLARKISTLPALEVDIEIEMTFEQFSLVQSTLLPQGAHYQSVADWPLKKS